MSNQVTLIINELEQQAAWFTKEAERQKDKFNKGYFEGKSEQSLRTIEALKAQNPAAAIDSLRLDA